MSKTRQDLGCEDIDGQVKPEDNFGGGQDRRILNQSENRINSMTKPQYDTMTGQELLAAYNAMSGSPTGSEIHTLMKMDNE